VDGIQGASIVQQSEVSAAATPNKIVERTNTGAINIGDATLASHAITAQQIVNSLALGMQFGNNRVELIKLPPFAGSDSGTESISAGQTINRPLDNATSNRVYFACGITSSSTLGIVDTQVAFDQNPAANSNGPLQIRISRVAGSPGGAVNVTWRAWFYDLAV
jgi:hypothetical protein